jgi:hypothetical protein
MAKCVESYIFQSRIAKFLSNAFSLHSEILYDTSLKAILKARESLVHFAYELGLDLAYLHNVEDIAIKILQNWREHRDQNVQPSHIHLFIALLEKGQQKKAIERKLTEIRLKNATAIENNTPSK